MSISPRIRIRQAAQNIAPSIDPALLSSLDDLGVMRAALLLVEGKGRNDKDLTPSQKARRARLDSCDELYLRTRFACEVAYLVPSASRFESCIEALSDDERAAFLPAARSDSQSVRHGGAEALPE